MKFSIVIPTRNRTEILKWLLIDLSKVDFGQNNVEVIVVDNSSDRNQKHLTHEFVKALPRELKVHYLYSPKEGSSIARNLGIKKSKYRHVIFLDDDNRISPDFIKNYETSWLKNKTAKAIGGRISPAIPGGMPKFVKPEFEWVYAFQDYGKKLIKLNYPHPLFTTNLSVVLTKNEKKKGILNEKLGRMYFGSTHFGGEDIELSRRLLINKKNMIYDPKIVTYNSIVKERINNLYYWKRIIKAGAEMKLVDTILSSRFAGYKEKLSLNKLKSSFKSLIKDTILLRKSRNIFWEHLAYTLGYYFLGTLIIVFYPVLS